MSSSPSSVNSSAPNRRPTLPRPPAPRRLRPSPSPSRAYRATLAVHALAGAPDIVRAYEKDAFYAGRIHAHLVTLTKTLIPSPRRLASITPHLPLISALIYHSATTLSGTDTLGEEYTGLLMIHGATATPPTRSTRALLLLLDLVVPALLARIASSSLSFTQELDESENSASNSQQDSRGTWWRVMLGSAIRNLGPTLGRAHLALFYFTGRYFQLSKRLLGLIYVTARRFKVAIPLSRVPALPLLRPVNAQFPTAGPILLLGKGTTRYAFLGSLLAFQLIVSGAIWIASRRSSGPAGNMAAGTRLGSGDEPLGNDDGDDDDDDRAAQGRAAQQASKLVETRGRCPLCLETRKGTTATNCGHLFCWKCINEWVQEKPECPLCRSSVAPQALLPVFGYSPS